MTKKSSETDKRKIIIVIVVFLSTFLPVNFSDSVFSFAVEFEIDYYFDDYDDCLSTTKCLGELSLHGNMRQFSNRKKNHSKSEWRKMTNGELGNISFGIGKIFRRTILLVFLLLFLLLFICSGGDIIINVFSLSAVVIVALAFSFCLCGVSI